MPGVPTLRPLAQLMVLAGLALVATGPASAAREPRLSIDVIVRYGLSGYIQPIGLHHGFHIEDVVPDSPAAQDRLTTHDIIVKVDGEPIRSLEHLRTLMNDAYQEDGMVLLTVMKERSLEHHVIKGYLKGREEVRPVRRERPSDPDRDDRR